jgi:hypothetical protein
VAVSVGVLVGVGVVVSVGVLVGVGVIVGHFLGRKPLGSHPAVGGGFLNRSASERAFGVALNADNPKLLSAINITTSNATSSRPIMTPPK